MQELAVFIHHLGIKGRIVNLFRLTQLDERALEQTSQPHDLGPVHSGIDLAAICMGTVMRLGSVRT
jgi:hypothetical protein